MARLLLPRILMLALTGCVPGVGPAPQTGTLHDPRTSWRAGCSHCWASATLGVTTRILAVTLLIVLWKGVS